MPRAAQKTDDPVAALIRERIRARLQFLEMSDNAASLEAGLNRGSIGDILAGRSGSPRTGTLKKIARVLKCTLGYLTGEEDEPGQAPQEVEPVGIVMAPFAGYVQAGAFVYSDFYDDDDHPPTPIARDPRFPRARLYAYRVRGDSMNLAGINSGDLIVAVDVIDAEMPAKTGDYVVVERTQDGFQTLERTIKEMKIHRDRVELLPRSSSKKHKPIVIKTEGFLAFSEGDGQVVSEDGFEVRVVAIVINHQRSFAI